MDINQQITHYATAIAGWEQWKQEYRFGAFYIFPPEPLRSKINRLREKYDPQSQKYCDAHLSLTIPLPRELNKADAGQIGEVLATFGEFILTYERPSSYHGIPGVVLKIQPADQLTELVRIIEATSAFGNAQPRRWPFSPHITIAEFLDSQRTCQIVDELAGLDLSGSFTCNEIAYAVPDQDFHFSERWLFKLRPHN